MKRTFLAVLAVFITWGSMDFVLHGVILSQDYAAVPQLWRPAAEMNVGLMFLVVFATAAAFVAVYVLLITEKGIKTGLRYGMLYGIGSGISMGYGSYSVMPLSPAIASWWFLGKFIEALVAGWLIGVIVKKQRKSNWVPFGIRERGDYIK